ASGITLNVTPLAVPVASVSVTVRDVCSNDTTKFTNAGGVSVFANSSSESVSALTASTGVGTLVDLVVGATYAITIPTPYNYSANYTVLSSGNAIAVNRSVSCTTAPPSGGA
ncbi:MAG: hypothetical protein ACOYNZ_18660, partial [Rhodoferax sp.]